MCVHIGDVPPSHFVWMPAHTGASQVDKARLSNGQRLSHADRRGNAEADKHAKFAAATFAAPKELRLKLACQRQVVLEAARWFGWVTWAASNDNPSGGRDSVASRAAANLVRERRLDHSTKRSGRKAPSGQHRQT